MFKHPHSPGVASSAQEADSEQAASERLVVTKTRAATPEHLRELLEKNLKWSQIIYEQNRRLNRKLLWMSIASWFKLALVVIPLILGLLFLPPFFRQLLENYGSLFQSFQSTSSTGSDRGAAVDQLIKLLPLNSAQQEQFKTLLK